MQRCDVQNPSFPQKIQRIAITQTQHSSTGQMLVKYAYNINLMGLHQTVLRVKVIFVILIGTFPSRRLARFEWNSINSPG